MTGDISRFRIGFENYVFERPEDHISLITGTVAGGSLSTLRAQQLSRQVTVASDSDGDIVIRWQGGSSSEPASREVQLVALCNVDVDVPGLAPYLRMQVTRYSGSTLLDHQIVEYDWWASDRGDRRLFTPNVTCLFETGETCDRVDIRLYGGTGPRTARIGPVWVGPVWAPDPVSGLEPGWAVVPLDTGTARRTASGAVVTRRRRVLRQLSGSLSIMPHRATYGREHDAASPVPDLQSLLHTIGTTRLVYVMPRTVALVGASVQPHTYGIFRLGFVGLCTQMGQIVKESGDNYRWDGFSFSEVQ